MLRPRLLYVFVVCLGVLTILNGLLVTTSTEKKIRDADSTGEEGCSSNDDCLLLFAPVFRLVLVAVHVSLSLFLLIDS